MSKSVQYTVGTFLAISAFLGTTGPAYSQQVIRWDVNRAVLAGSGCQKDVDAFIIEAGNDVAVVFSNLGVELADRYAPLAARKTCMARIAASVAKGLYIGTLTQNVSFGVSKSFGSEAGVGVMSSFAGYRLPPLNVSIGRNRRADGDIQTASRRDDFLVNGRGMCNRNIPVMYQAQLTASGSRSTINDFVITQIDGLDVRFEATAGVYTCPIR